MSESKSATYKDAGVDIDAGNRLVERIKPIVKSTRREGVLGGIGGFGGHHGGHSSANMARLSCGVLWGSGYGVRWKGHIIE